jgi:cobalamin biosynthesis protein CobW
MVRGAGGNVPASVLLGIDATAEADMVGRESHHELQGEEHEHDDFDSFVVQVGPSPSVSALEARVTAALQVSGVLRVKGRAMVDGKAAAAVVQAVGPRVEVSFTPAGAGGALVVIGLRCMDRSAIRAALAG